MRVALFSILLAVSVQAADPIATALPCGKVGVSGGLGTGTDLQKNSIDTAVFPNAVCNDGTPAVFYYAAATGNADRNKWIIFLQGGGSCTSGLKCAERWCSVNSNYGLDKMSSSVTKAQIAGNGFLSPEARNRFGTWNRVLVYYCSSDNWQGTKANVLDAPTPAGTREYAIEFRGSQIIDAVLDTLRNAKPGKRRRAASHGVSVTPIVAPEAAAWPDLDDATDVIFAGSSGGGNGVRNNADRVGARLESANAGLADYRAVIDAVFTPDTSALDYTQTAACAENPNLCTYEAFTRNAWNAVDVALIAGRGDESCRTFHNALEAGSEWRCNDKDHVFLHHITTPFFVRQDLQDSDVGANFVESHFGTASDYAIGVESTFRSFPVPEEPRGAAPGVFAPQCADHESFSHNIEVFDVRVDGLNWNDTVWNWWTGAQPQQVIKAYNGVPGPAAGCP